MYQIDRTIATEQFEGLKVKKLVSKDDCETLLIVLQKGHLFPEHTAPRDALLVLLEGAIRFQINNTDYQIEKYQTFTFPACVKHQVYANENSKFLIIR